MAKTSLNQHLLRSDSTSAAFKEIKDSKDVVEFGQKNLSVPGSRAGIKERIFMDQLPAEVLRKKEMDSTRPEEGKTIAGISSKYEYICKVNNLWDYVCVLRCTL